MAKKKEKRKQRNYVQKHAWEMNKHQVMTDRKKSKKKGYQKHKSRQAEPDDFCVSVLRK